VAVLRPQLGWEVVDVLGCVEKIVRKDRPTWHETVWGLTPNGSMPTKGQSTGGDGDT
jgi:hypothetical protein